MEAYLHTIETTKHIPSDEVFATQIRLQLLAQKTVPISEQKAAGYYGLVPDEKSSSHRNLQFLKTVQEQLQALIASLAPHLQQHGG